MTTTNLPDKVVLVCSSTEATTTSKNGNSNKFHKWEKLPNGNYMHQYGRVGDDGQKHEVSPSKMQAKMKDALKHGYTQVQTIDSAPVDSIKQGVASFAKGGGFDVVKTAEEEIAKGDPVIAKLVKFLSDQNVHNISSSTKMKYDAATGLFSTPLGIVTKGSIDQARKLLSLVQNQVKHKHRVSALTESEANKLTTEYLMLIPTDIGRDRPTFDNVFSSLTAVEKQNDILDSLEGSLVMASKQPAQTLTATPAPTSIWDIELKRMDNTREIERIRQKFFDTHANPRHTQWDVRNVYDIGIKHMRTAFGSEGKKVGKVEEMWHGTSVGNILSIFAKGLIIPAHYSNGRNFGNGVYASRQSHKSLSYASTFRSRDRSSCYMFLVDVAMGRSYEPEGTFDHFPKGYDSTDVRPGGRHGFTNHEAIVYKTSQVDVTRLVEFQMN